MEHWMERLWLECLHFRIKYYAFVSQGYEDDYYFMTKLAMLCFFTFRLSLLFGRIFTACPVCEMVWKCAIKMRLSSTIHGPLLGYSLLSPCIILSRTFLLRQSSFRYQWTINQFGASLWSSKKSFMQLGKKESYKSNAPKNFAKRLRMELLLTNWHFPLKT